jgi:energy-coupling factor transport system ATP-binding protein
VLDEPTSQLDPVGSEELLASVRRLSEDTGSTIILAEHRVERCLHLATRVVALEDGAVAHDDHPGAFARWAAAEHPGWLPPVARLFGRRSGARSAEEGDAIPAPDDDRLPLTVKDARARLDRHNGYRPVRLTPTPGAARGDAVLEARGLTIGYEPEMPLVEDLDLSLHRGEVIALMGENGVGKSTLVKHFNGLLRPLRGRIRLAGHDLTDLPVSAAAHHCAYLGQNPGDYFVKESVAAEIDYSLDALGIEPARRARLRKRVADDLDLHDLMARDPRKLSGGERTRAALATVACGEPPLLVLDEPTRGMDPAHKAHLAARLVTWASRDRCIVVVTHDVEFAARAATRVVILGANGALADGPPSDVLDGALFFTTQVNRLLRETMPGVLLDDEVRWETTRR